MPSNNFPLPRRTKERVANCKTPLVRQWERNASRQQSVVTQLTQAPSTQAVPTPSIQALPTPSVSSISQSPWPPQGLLIPPITTLPSALHQDIPYSDIPFVQMQPSSNWGLTPTMSPLSDSFNNGYSQSSQGMASGYHNPSYTPSGFGQQHQAINSFMSAHGFTTTGFDVAYQTNYVDSFVTIDFAYRAVGIHNIHPDGYGNQFIIGSLGMAINGVILYSFSRFYIKQLDGVVITIGQELFREYTRQLEQLS